MKHFDSSRRRTLAGPGAFAGASLLRGQEDPFRDDSRVPGLGETVTTMDFEEVFHHKVPREDFNSKFTKRRRV